MCRQQPKNNPSSSSSMTTMRMFPLEVVRHIMEYDGRFRWDKTSNTFVGIIHATDERRPILTTLFMRRKSVQIDISEDNKSSYYFECPFHMLQGVGLVYDYHWTQSTVYEICYYDFRKGILQIRTTCL